MVEGRQPCSSNPAISDAKTGGNGLKLRVSHIGKQILEYQYRWPIK